MLQNFFILRTVKLKLRSRLLSKGQGLWFLLFYLHTVSLIGQTLSTHPPAESFPHPQKFAIVIGISKYQNPGIPQLQYADKDAEVFADFLKSKAGGSVPDQNIRLLTNENASFATIYQALYWLPDTVHNGDIVYFYFSGHGAVENTTLDNLGFLLAYNSPRNNFLNNAVRIEDLNNFANTLTIKNGAKVILITDACHSGKLSGSDNTGKSFIGTQLRTVQGSEIRLSSCTEDQLSAEDEGWGGGRGVFSYYLVNGLKGLADANHDNWVSVSEIKQFLDSTLSKDLLLAKKNLVQTPITTGNPAFNLSEVDSQTLNALVNKNSSPGNLSSPSLRLLPPLPKQPADYFFEAIAKSNPEEIFDFDSLNKLPTDQIPYSIIEGLPTKLLANMPANTIAGLRNLLQHNSDALQRFKDKMSVILSNRGQEIINLYLEGDAAELDRRSYYNQNHGYDSYPAMFAVAMKLTPPQSYLYHILQVDQHYFAGVAARIKIPKVPHPEPLLQKALQEEEQAIALEANAAYIQNEMAVLKMAKKQFQEAEKYLIRATQISPQWAIPFANLCGLYGSTGRKQEAFHAAAIADSLQPTLSITKTNTGLLFEKSSNYLLAEENYRRSIDLNSRDYLPFERLAVVYLNTARFMQSDSFFMEAEKRKKGFYFQKNPFNMLAVMSVLPAAIEVYCPIDTLHLDKDDIMAFFSWAIQNYSSLNYGNALRVYRKIVALDPRNPLVYHYIGKIYYDLHQWEQAELMFKLAKDCYLKPSDFENYISTLLKNKVYSYDHSCFENKFRESYYSRIEDDYFLATLEENWGHYEQAENFCRDIIRQTPQDIAGYHKLWALYERLGLYLEAEKTIQSYTIHDLNSGQEELNAFYKRAIGHFPEESYWPYQLGLLLYEKAKRPAVVPYLDTVVYFPPINKEKFIDLKVFSSMVNDSSLSLGSERSEFQAAATRPIDLRPPSIKILEPNTFPGTRENYYLADHIVTPRYDGMYYLKQAAQMMDDSSIQADIYYKIGNIYSWAGSPSQAFIYYDSSIQLAANNASAQNRVIETAIKTYHNQAEMASLEYLYQHQQIDWNKQLLLGYLYSYSSRFEEAKNMENQLLSFYPYYLAPLDELGATLNLLSGNYKLSKDYFQSLQAHLPKDSMVLYNLARLSEKSGNHQEAIKYIRLALLNGFRYPYVLELDPFFNKLRFTKGWKDLMKTYAIPPISY